MRAGRLTRLVIGLTGGIGSGKSAVSRAFAEFGAGVVDTDVISHALTGPGGGAIPALREAFGERMITPEGALDRAAMREEAFTHPASRARLEALLHPRIRETAIKACEAQLAGGVFPYVVLVVPLLLETRAYANVIHRVVVVDCPDDIRIARIAARSGLEESRIRAIMAAQVSRETRLAAADDVIDNRGDLSRLREIVAALHQKYLELARKP